MAPRHATSPPLDEVPDDDEEEPAEAVPAGARGDAGAAEDPEPEDQAEPKAQTRSKPAVPTNKTFVFFPFSSSEAR